MKTTKKSVFVYILIKRINRTLDHIWILIKRIEKEFTFQINIIPLDVNDLSKQWSGTLNRNNELNTLSLLAQ